MRRIQRSDLMLMHGCGSDCANDGSGEGFGSGMRAVNGQSRSGVFDLDRGESSRRRFKRRARQPAPRSAAPSRCRRDPALLSGSATTVGRPLSICSRMRMSSGNSASRSTPYCCAMRRPPPAPKMCSSWPQFEQTCVLMFSTMPSTGTSTFWNIRSPFRASSSAMSCGVVTMTAPLTGTRCDRVSCVSPVPGGMSTIR